MTKALALVTLAALNQVNANGTPDVAPDAANVKVATVSGLSDTFVRGKQGQPLIMSSATQSALDGINSDPGGWSELDGLLGLGDKNTADATRVTHVEKNKQQVELNPAYIFDEMKKLAEKLSKGIPQVRVDFYEIDGKVYFGELTFCHFAALTPFEPEEWDYKLGEYINLPRKSFIDKIFRL